MCEDDFETDPQVSRSISFTSRFAPSQIQTHGLTSQWLYDFVADQWSHWLPEATKKTIKVAGYYTVQMQHGLRLVVLNNNDCYTYNFWIYYDPQYLVGQLQWLHDTLLQAETKKEKVHIIAHVPSGDDTCLKVWSREYRRILDRFWNTIVAQFNGHTHSDTFNVIYSRESVDHAIGQAWNGGSFTTYSHLNRNYAVYEVDRESFVSRKASIDFNPSSLTLSYVKNVPAKNSLETI
jgi:sphingomyelin phosphodiesterase